MARSESVRTSPKGLLDHYGVLRVPRNADDVTIRAAYKRLALETHPDKGGSDNSFCAVSAAFDTLSSRSERKAYDALLAQSENPCQKSNGASYLREPDHCKATRVSTLEKALSKLQVFISRLDRDARHQVFKSLPQQVSESLIAWMESQKAFGASVARREDGTCVQNDQEKSRSISSCTDVVPLHPDVRSRGSELSRSPHGIKKAGGDSRRYQSTVSCINLLLTSQSVDLATALQFRIVLVLIRNSLSDEQPLSEFLDVQQLTGRMERVIKVAHKTAGVEYGTLRISFTPNVSARREFGSKIYGHKTEDFGAALIQRAELLAAKEAGWFALRTAWLRILADRMSMAQAVATVDSACAKNRSDSEAGPCRGQSLKAIWGVPSRSSNPRSQNVCVTATAAPSSQLRSRSPCRSPLDLTFTDLQKNIQRELVDAVQEVCEALAAQGRHGK